MIGIEKMSRLDLAHHALRIYLGVNILLHGAVRLPKLGAFAEGLRGMFAESILPEAFVTLSGYAIPIAEVVIGLLLLIGLWRRHVLVAGMALMTALTAGMCLIEKWDAVGLQVAYALAYFALIATLPTDHTESDPNSPVP